MAIKTDFIRGIIPATVTPMTEDEELNERGLEQLLDFPAVLPGATTFTRGILDREISKLGLEIKVRMSTNYLETIKMLVSINQGWSLLPATMIDSDLVALHLPIQLQRSLGIVTHSGRTLSNAAHALSEILLASDENAD